MNQEPPKYDSSFQLPHFVEEYLGTRFDVLYHHVKERNARSIKIELIGDGLASRDNFDDRKKNADIPEKEGRFTKHVFKTLLTLNIKSHNTHTSQ